MGCRFVAYCTQRGPRAHVAPNALEVELRGSLIDLVGSGVERPEFNKIAALEDNVALAERLRRSVQLVFVELREIEAKILARIPCLWRKYWGATTQAGCGSLNLALATRPHQRGAPAASH
jgi:hypothetical protein